MSKESLLHFGSLESIDDEPSSWSSFASTRYKMKKFFDDSFDFSKKALEMGRKDPRKVVYAFKMGLALALVSLLIFWDMPVEDATQYSIWAILTVIVMFEFSIGSCIDHSPFFTVYLNHFFFFPCS